jgi:hypothetical protein
LLDGRSRPLPRTECRLVEFVIVVIVIVVVVVVVVEVVVIVAEVTRL